jgi:hypothetical protein
MIGFPGVRRVSWTGRRIAELQASEARLRALLAEPDDGVRFSTAEVAERLGISHDS